MNLPAANDLRGLWVPVVTPFDADDCVDVAALEQLCRRLLADGARGIVALGTTGEPDVLTGDEQRAVIEVCAQTCSDLGGSLMVGTGTNSTRSTVAATRALASVPGVSAALVVVPYYTRPSGAAVVEHYRIVAAESPVPVVAYHIPYRTGRELSVDELLALAAIDNVAGLKQSVGCLDAATLQLLRDAPAGFQVLSGDDAYIVPTVLMGGVGAISAAAHVCTRQFATMIDDALAGDVVGARTRAERLLPVVIAGFAEPNPALWKAALHHLGELSTPDLRRPMANASAEVADELMATIAVALRTTA